jgi:hypothetical protein
MRSRWRCPLLRLLRADTPGEISRDPRSWPRWVRLLPHVLAVTAYFDRERAPATGLLRDASWLPDRAGAYLRVHGTTSHGASSTANA